MSNYINRFIIVFILVVLTPSSIFSQTAINLDNAVNNCTQYLQVRFPKGTRIALIAIQSENQEIGDIAYRRLSNVLVNGGWFTVVERNASALDSINQEMDRHLNAWVSEATELSIGKQLGAEVIISGNFNRSAQNWNLEIKAISVERAQVMAQWSTDVRQENTWTTTSTSKIAGISFEGDILSVARDRQTVITGLRNAMQTNNSTFYLDEKSPYGVGYGFTIYLNQVPAGNNLIQTEVTVSLLQGGRILYQSNPYYITETTETMIARRIVEKLRADQAFFNKVNDLTKQVER